MLLSNRLAIITGGAKGIGKGIALKFAEEGCSVVIADININEANKTVNLISGKGKDGLAIQCDVTDSKQVKGTVETVIRKYGKIDILVNNAGGMSAAPPIEDLDEEMWDKIVALNLKSNYLFSKAVIPYMKVNAIVPGLIETEFYNPLAGLTTDEQRKAFFTKMGNMVPLKRMGTPEDIAGAALYLASDLGGYVTGTSILVAGGLPLMAQNIS